MSRKSTPAASGGKRYRQVAERLIEDIHNGKFPVGSRLPGELELVDAFGVSRHTVREALRRLEELGLIGRRQGVGTVVLTREPTRSYVQAVRSPAALLQYPEGCLLAVRSVEEIRAGRALARLLQCRTGAAWLHVSCLRRFEDERPPVCWVDLYLLPEYRAIVPRIGRKPGLVHELIQQEHGQQVGSVDVTIMARATTARIAGPLGVEPGSPSLTVVRRYTSPEGRLFLASVSEHPGDRFTYTLSLERGWQAGSGAVWGAG